jgi:hypothetical protein
MGISDAEREAGTIHSLVENHQSKHFGSRSVNGVFVARDRDMSEAEGLDQCVYHLYVRDDLVSWSSCRRWHEGQFLPVDLAVGCDER